MLRATYLNSLFRHNLAPFFRDLNSNLDILDPDRANLPRNLVLLMIPSLVYLSNYHFFRANFQHYSRCSTAGCLANWLEFSSKIDCFGACAEIYSSQNLWRHFSGSSSLSFQMVRSHCSQPFAIVSTKTRCFLHK